jgi:uncharacterized protein YggE
LKPQSFALLVGSLLIAAIGLLVVGPATRGDAEPQVVAVSEAEAAPRLLTVTGTSETWVKPNTAYLSIVIRKDGASAQEAEALAGAFADTLQRQLADLKLSGYDLQFGPSTVGKLEAPAVAQPPAQTVPEGMPVAAPPQTTYQGSVRLFVRTTDLKALDQLRTLVWELGGEVEGITYTLGPEEAESARKTALAGALDKALARAQILAARSGGAVGDLQNLVATITKDLPGAYDQTATTGPTGLVEVEAEVTATYKLD